MNINIPGIDTAAGIRNSSSEELLLELFGDVYKIIDDKSSLAETYLKEKDLKNYTILVHGLKTTCRMIGAIDLGEDFYTLEKLGKENNLEQIEKLTPDVLNSFRALKPYLEPYASKSEEASNEFDVAAISGLLNKLLEAIADFDLGPAEEATKQLLSYSCDEVLAGKIKDLEKLVSNLDYDEAKELAGRILLSLQ